MYVGLKQPRGDGKRYVTPARAAAKETKIGLTLLVSLFYAQVLVNLEAFNMRYSIDQ